MYLTAREYVFSLASHLQFFATTYCFQSTRSVTSVFSPARGFASVTFAYKRNLLTRFFFTKVTRKLTGFLMATRFQLGLAQNRKYVGKYFNVILAFKNPLLYLVITLPCSAVR
jgi:hypothetical protein